MSLLNTIFLNVQKKRIFFRKTGFFSRQGKKIEPRDFFGEISLLEMNNTQAREMNSTQATYNYTPSVAGIHKMIRASGYEILDSVLEYPDNSNDAGATNVDIILYPIPGNGEQHIEKLLIFDNGKGMSFTEMQNGLTIAFEKRARDMNSIGEYGLGMKSASLNLGDEFVLVSKRAEDDDFVGARIDFMDQERNNSFEPTLR